MKSSFRLEKLGTSDPLLEGVTFGTGFETRNRVWEPSETGFGRFRMCLYIAESESDSSFSPTIYQIEGLDEPNSRMPRYRKETGTGNHFRKPK